MVFGPAMDVMRARKEGVPSIKVLMQGNQLVSSRLTLRAKLTFWCTNCPYWILSWFLLVAPPTLPAGVGSGWHHGLAVASIGFVSSAYHGLVLTIGVQRSRPALGNVTAVLLGLDVITANCYGLTLALNFGLVRCLTLFIFPLLFLVAASVLKRRGNPCSYAVVHGMWHVLSATSMWRVLYYDDLGHYRLYHT